MAASTAAAEQPTVRTLASLPTSLFSTSTSTSSSSTTPNPHFGSCHSLVNVVGENGGKRKRKRFEVSAAIDGQTLNYYDVQTGQSVTSYAVHPDTIFCAPASSLRVSNGNRNENVAPVRYTAAAVRGVAFELVLWRETVDEGRNPVVERFESIGSGDVEREVAHVEVVPSSRERSAELELEPEVLVVYKDREVTMFTADLKDVVLKGSKAAEAGEVVFAKWISKFDADAGVLRDRADLRREHEVSASSYLLLISREGEGDSAILSSRIVELPVSSADQSLCRSQPDSRLKELLIRQLPNTSRFVGANCQIQFHAPSARLSIASANGVVDYDLSAYSLVQTPKFSRFGDYPTPLFPMTESMVAAMRPHFIDVYETTHSSIRVSHPLRQPKRARLNAEYRGNVRFIVYFQKLNSLIAVRGRNLVAFPVPATRSSGLSSQKGVSLIDAIGSKAIHKQKVATGTLITGQPAISKILFPATSPSSWEASEKALDEHHQQRRVDLFETVMAKELCSGTVMKDSKSEDFPLPHHSQFVNPDKIRFLITNIFSVSGDHISAGRDVDVYIAFFPPRLFVWLAEQGFLLDEEIGRALSTAACPRMRVKPGSIAGAILRQDSSLGLLQKYLEGSNVVTLEGVFAVVQLFIDDRISRGRMDVDPSLEETNQQPEESAQQPATNGADTAVVSSAEVWRENAATVLNRALQILHRFTPSSIVAAMREKLDGEQALFLIQYLRHELFQSGIISTSAGTPTNSKSKHSLAPPITVTLLGYCIDALGPIPLTDNPIHGPIWGAIVPDLRIEISLALHSINEANYLKGILREVVRFGQNATKPNLIKRKNQEISSGSGSKPVVVWDQDEDQAMLPLDLRPHNGISRVKRRRGGGEIVPRSGREVLQLESRMVGSYTFERLVI